LAQAFQQSRSSRGDERSPATLGSTMERNTGAVLDQYFYHQDHLGSTGYVTGFDGEVYQHLEYFPFGEQWVNEVVDNSRVRDRVVLLRCQVL
jgi:hypothetical protein